MRKPPYTHPITDGDIYQAIIGYCEELEHKGTYTGNGHHLAQKLAAMVITTPAITDANSEIECLIAQGTSKKSIEKRLTFVFECLSEAITITRDMETQVIAGTTRTWGEAKQAKIIGAQFEVSVVLMMLGMAEPEESAKLGETK